MNAFIVIGLLINVAFQIVNRFVVKIPNKMAILILLIGIACLLIGAVQVGQGGLFCGKK
ncbi:MAG: hypothetical protein IJO39_12825 [Clostridia bacterium]|nr:hypothetical protein [Clostridia bacterium]